MLGCFWSLYALKNIIPQKLLCCIEKNSIEEENCDLLYAVFFNFFLLLFFWYNFWGSVPFVSCVQEGLTTAIVAGVEEREDFFGLSEFLNGMVDNMCMEDVLKCYLFAYRCSSKCKKRVLQSTQCY